MSDPASSTPVSDEQPKRSWFKRVIKIVLFCLVLLSVAVGISSYYLSVPFAWPAGLGSPKKSAVEERFSALESTIDQKIEQTLADFSSSQAQSRSQSEARMKKELETASEKMTQLDAVVNEISLKLAEIEREDPTQTARLQEFNDRLDGFQITLQEIRAQVNATQSAVESGLGRPVTEQDVQDLIVNRAELLDAYWTVREIQEQINKGSKAQALTGFDALLTQWRQSPNSDLSALVPLMTQQQAVLNDWAPTQWNDWQILIQGWLSESDGWRFSKVSSAAFDEGLNSQSEPEPDGGGWLARMTRLFAGIVQVRPRAVGALSARDQHVARANIEQRLLLLQMAVASQNVPSIRSQAAGLASEIERLFLANDTQAVLDGLQTLASLEDSPPPDVLREVQQSIERALYQP